MKRIAVLQARMTSTRLPGKVLFKCGQKSILEWVVNALKRVDSINEICVAMPNGDPHDPILAESLRLGCKIFRGSEYDVLNRFYEAAKFYSADEIIRVTTDCPYTDPSIISELISLHEETNADYSCNNEPFTYPHGLDVECFTFEILEKANTEALLEYDREHVTPWIKRYESISKTYLKYNVPNVSSIRVTIDTTEDFELFCEVERQIGNQLNNVDALIKLFKSQPNLQDIVKNSKQR